MLTTEAAVLREPGDIGIETVELDPPKSSEVLVDMRATGICHTDYRRYAGEAPVPFPIVLGHEGTGVIESVGEDITTVEAGDRVLLSFNGSCGSCPACSVGNPDDCDRGLEIAFGGTLLDGTRRLTDETGEEVNHFFAQSSFARKAVVPERTVIPIPDDVAFSSVAPLGCGARTGIGAVLNTAGVTPGDTVAVFGCGGLGMSAITAAVGAVSAREVIAVDVVEQKLEWATDLGATLSVDATETDPVEFINEHTDGGVDYAFEFTGDTNVMAQTLAATREGGTAIISGATEPGEHIKVPAGELLRNRTLRGNLGGESHPQVDVPTYIDLYRQGDLALDKLLTRTYDLSDIEAAFSAIEAGEVIRTAITFDE